MLPIEKLKAVQTIVSHENCADGTVAALLCRDALPWAKVVFMQHGTEALKNLRAEPGMLFVDFAPPADKVAEFVAAGTLVLDHHKSAKSVVEAFGDNGVFADEVLEPGVSGAVLAFREVWEPLMGDKVTPVQRDFAYRFAMLTGIRDTWQRQSELWEAACMMAQVMFLVPVSVWFQNTLSELSESWNVRFGWLGPILMSRQNNAVERSVQGGLRQSTQKGTRVILFNNLSHTSDAAELLGAEVDVVVGFSYQQDNGAAKLIFSTRSHTDFDCAAFCRAMGGGGHTKAAGFSLIDDGTTGPYQTFMRLLNTYEAA